MFLFPTMGPEMFPVNSNNITLILSTNFRVKRNVPINVDVLSLTRLTARSEIPFFPRGVAQISSVSNFNLHTH